MIKFRVKVMLALREMTQKDLGTVKHLPIEALDKICAVLDCQPADLMEYVNDDVGGVK